MSQIQVLFAQADISDFQQIANMFNTTRRMAERSIKNEFSIGQKVQWTGRKGFQTGMITKINRKNIVVNAGSAGMWNVAPSLLTAA